MTSTSSEIDFGPQTALVVVDMQNDFADPAGNLSIDGGEAIIPSINGLIRTARRAGSLVVYTQDWHPPSTPHFDTDGGNWPVHCVAGTWGAALHPNVDFNGPVVRKGTGGEDGYSAFTARDVTTGEDKPTDLRSVLEERNVTDVVVVGLAQDVCVKETVLDARRLGHPTTVPLAATRPVESAGGDAAVDEMRKAGAIVQ